MNPSRSDPPRGRGALISALLNRQKQESTSSENAPAPRGRAALLLSLRNKTTSVLGEPSTQATGPVTTLESGVSGLQIKDKQGFSGTKVTACANYISLKLKPEQGVFEYEVQFEPVVDSMQASRKMVSGIIKEFACGNTFDGKTLYLAEQVINTKKTFNVVHPFSKENIDVTIIYKRRRSVTECIHLYNVLFKKIMYTLEYLRFGRQFFDKSHSILIPMHKLEIWPGYVTAVNEFDGGIMLCLDVQHRVLRTQNVLEVIADMRARSAHNFRQRVQELVVGTSVLTRYNNKVYVLHDVMWNASPRSSFRLADGKNITFCEYYQRQYGLTITDLEQPMLVTRQSVNVAGQTSAEERLTLLVPELCHLTGLTDDMRADFRMMKDVAQHTRVKPNERIQALQKYISSVMACKEASDILSAWGMTIDSGTIDLNMRVLDPELLIFGNDSRHQSNAYGDWTAAVNNNTVLQGVNFEDWLLLYTSRDKREAEEFIASIVKLGPKMGIRIFPPEAICLQDDRNETYSNLLSQKITSTRQLVCVISPSNRDDRYSAIKKICCVKLPIPSQVINARTLRNRTKLATIIHRIALQINCKLGGCLWTLKFPFKKWMICGMDVHHSTGHLSKTVCGFVNSMNDAITQWYSVCGFHSSKREISDHLKPLFVQALTEFREANGTFPSTVVVYRDGVGDGDMNTVKLYEVPQFLEAASDLGIDIKLLYIVVQKRINTRMFLNENGQYLNPNPGSIVDHTITKPAFYDFFLVAQQVRSGTVTPTHYAVLYDSTNLKPDNVQRLTYKLCHMYFNWTGTIRVPAPCQYAHKLAFLVGQSIGSTPSPNLARTLFYL